MADMRNESNPISFLALQVLTRSIPYQLRLGNTKITTTMKRTMRANDFYFYVFLIPIVPDTKIHRLGFSGKQDEQLFIGPFSLLLSKNFCSLQLYVYVGADG